MLFQNWNGIQKCFTESELRVANWMYFFTESETGFTMNLNLDSANGTLTWYRHSGRHYHSLWNECHSITESLNVNCYHSVSVMNSSQPSELEAAPPPPAAAVPPLDTSPADGTSPPLLMSISPRAWPGTSLEFSAGFSASSAPITAQDTVHLTNHTTWHTQIYINHSTRHSSTQHSLLNTKIQPPETSPQWLHSQTRSSAQLCRCTETVCHTFINDVILTHTPFYGTLGFCPGLPG